MVELVELIHAAALDPTGWDAILSAVIAEVGGRRGMLQAPTFPGRSNPYEYYAIQGFDRAFIDANMPHYTPNNPLQAGMVADVGGDFGRVAWVYRACDPDDYARTPFWNDYWLKLGGGDMLSLVLDIPEDAPPPVLSIVLDPRSDGFSDSQVDRFQALAPHLKFAAGLRRRAARGALPTDVDRALLEMAPTACILLDSGGRILFANARAQAVARHLPSLRITGGRLETASPGQNASLQAALLQASQRRAGGARMGRSLSLTTARGPLAVTVLPVGEDNPLVGDLSAVRAVVYLETEQAQVPTDQALQRLASLFSLSAAQAEVAMALLDGLAPAEIAMIRRRSRRTVEHQVAEVLRRTGARRLSDLHALRPLLQS